MNIKEVRKAFIVSLAAAAAAKKRKKNSDGGNTSSNAAGATPASDLCSEIERTFDSMYVIDETEKIEKCDAIFIDPAENGKVTRPFNDLDFYLYIIINLESNALIAKKEEKRIKLMLAVKNKNSQEYDRYDLESEEYMRFARNHDKLHARYVKPLQDLVIEGKIPARSRTQEYDDLVL